MVKIEIDDEVWSLYKKSWALMGIRTDEKLIDILEKEIQRESLAIIDAAKKDLIDDTPEAYVQREIGLEKERKRRLQTRLNKDKRV